MLPILMKTLPFFALIGLGWVAGRTRFFPAEAVRWLTKFVFYFALSAMLFRFAATLPIETLFDLRFVLAYVVGSFALWVLALGVALARRESLAMAAMEAHTAMTGNTGFLGVPMLVALLGPAAAGPVLMVLTADMIIFSTLITLVITGAAHGRVSVSMIKPLALGILRNPMIGAMAVGLAWSVLHLPMPGPLEEFTRILGAAATPGALFAIGATLATQPKIEKLGPALWLSFAKLILHPAAIALSCLAFGVGMGPAGVMLAAAALPVAGNVPILASHFGIGEQRVAATILISTAASILTVSAVIAYISGPH